MITIFDKFLRNNLLWTEGRRDLILSLILIVSSVFFSSILLLVSSFFFVFLLFFYRNPQRELPKELAQDDALIISPADGKILFLDVVDNLKKISIFLSPFDVHVNWIPINGKIESVHYKPGKFLMAFRKESGELNERNDITIINKYGTVRSRQVAGLLARRIVCWFRQHQEVHINEKYGMIKFGSRVDVFVPVNVQLFVKVGERVKGGITVLGKFTGVSEKC